MECGHGSFTILAGILDGTAVKPEVLSHEAPFGVGYGVVTYAVEGKDDRRHFLQQYEKKDAEAVASKEEDPYVALARQSVESWVKEHKALMVPEGLPPEMLTRKAGVFVSLHEYGELRGCIGTISAMQKNIALEIIQNGISACSRDPRFAPVEEKELAHLVISVDVLGQTEPVLDLGQLDAKKYGVIVTKDGRRGLLLPNLEGVNTPQEQIRIACRKAGIDPEEEGIELERFEVVRHG
jgi:AmmeMemoRadiSam system protein A